MKCPCCGSTTDHNFIIVHNAVYRADGTVLRAPPGVLRLFQRLLKGSVAVGGLPTNKRYTVQVEMSRLRVFLRENNFPYSINSNGVYTLKHHTS